MILPKYPIFILSKGRWESRMTARTLEEMNCPYKIVIEEQEYDNYAAVIDPKKILVLPFSNLGLGGIPARNWIWEYSIAQGDKKHHILDDNVRYFYWVMRNTKLRVQSTVPFRVLEDYTDRFTNVKMSGFNYRYFAPADTAKAPVTFNTRVYSTILLDNSIKERWRVLSFDGKPAPYNEDTDLSLNILKAGHCTMLFNSFVSGKTSTGVMKGGNTQEVYKYGDNEQYDNRYKFAASLAQAHPDVTTVVKKHGRFHHQVDYRPFENNKLILKPGIEIPRGVDNYGLKLVRVNDDQVPQGIVKMDDIQQQLCIRD